MKYIKTFEKHITLSLDDTDQVFLMTQYINEYDRVDNYQKKIFINRIKNLFKNGFDPNVNFVNSSVPFAFILERTAQFYNELLEIFVRFGLNGTTAKKLLENDVINFLRNDNFYFMKKLKILLDCDIDLLEKVELPYPKYNGLNIFQMIDMKLTDGIISIKYYEKVIDIIKSKKPEQYEQYLTQKEANKYNL